MNNKETTLNIILESKKRPKSLDVWDPILNWLKNTNIDIGIVNYELHIFGLTMLEIDIVKQFLKDKDMYEYIDIKVDNQYV